VPRYSRSFFLSLAILAFSGVSLGTVRSAEAAEGDVKKPKSRKIVKASAPTTFTASNGRTRLRVSTKSTKSTKSTRKPKNPFNKDQTLAKVTSDRDGNVSRLVAVLDDDAFVQGVRFDTKIFTSTPASFTSKSYSVDEISSARGVVLLNVGGYDAVFLKAAVDSKAGKGRIEVKYLADALWSSYRVCRGLVERDENGAWRILNSETNRHVDEFFVQTHAMGITNIKGICP